ncbi:MAG: aminodeoxychorismate lyase [Proteobacteria bacterium]|nr:aminodeoxychorismate lyase [Pseudomonadota bacterium]
MPTWRIWRGEYPIATLDPGDRGLAYGDGLFETILIHAGQPVWWDAHMARLRRGCNVLGMAMPDGDFLRTQCAALSAGCARGALKLIVTRGVGERGYVLPAEAPPTLVMGLSKAPQPPPREGLTLRWCDTRLSIQPRLAGIKHLNRLEQVLARAEWSDPAIHEGLLRDTAGRVVCATSANLFALRDGRWITPPVRDCGIEGVCRGWLLRNVPQAVERGLSVEEIETADAVILCNAVRGILPVAALGMRRWSPHVAAVEDLRNALAASEPAFASP